MELSIVILNYKTKNLIKELLKNLEQRKFGFSYEIIVVDNNSGDGVGEYLSQNCPAVRFISSERNGGYAYGNNLGIKQALGDFVLICNPDLAFLTPAIEQMLEYMKKNPRVGLASPRLINADKSLQYSCTSFPDWHLPLYRRTSLGKSGRGKLWLQNYLLEDMDHYQDVPVPALFGACMIARKSAIDKVGLLDERFIMYMEDLDWSRRFWESGFRVIYLGTIEVVHLHRRESAEQNILKILFSKTARQHIFSFIKYLSKYRNKPLPRVE